MDWRKVGAEAYNYAFIGLAGFGAGALIGKMNNSSPFAGGGIMAVGILASKALRGFIRNKSVDNDIHLSNYHITKNIAGTVLSLATAVAFFAAGILSTTGLMMMVGSSLAFCAIEIGIGLYIKYTENDELMGDIDLNKPSPWYLIRAYA